MTGPSSAKIRLAWIITLIVLQINRVEKLDQFEHNLAEKKKKKEIRYRKWEDKKD